MLKGTVTAMPVLLTLQSGAAMARSSNLISAASPGTTDRHGRTLCLDLDTVYPADSSGHVYDVGEPAWGKVTAINDRVYHHFPWRHSRNVSEVEMCERGGTYFYRDRRGSMLAAPENDEGGQEEAGPFAQYLSSHRWKSVEVRQGVIVSATALTSFGGEIHVYDL